MSSKTWDRVAKKLRCLDAIRRAEDLDDSRRFLLARIVNTYIELTGEDKERFDAELKRHDNKEVRDMVVTWEEALAESAAEGEARSKQEDILFIAGKRFSSIPREFESAIRSIFDLDRLRRILDQILDVDAIDVIDLA